MKTSVIVAASENNVIGKNNDLPWKLPDDLKYFKKLTMGHHMIMGRKTYDSIGKPLPGRTSVIVSRNKDYQKEGCVVVNSINSATDVARNAGDDEVFVIGGAEIINQAIHLVDRIYLTKVHAQVEGDIFLKDFNETEWKITDSTYHPADEKHQYAFSFLILEKK